MMKCALCGQEGDGVFWRAYKVCGRTYHACPEEWPDGLTKEDRQGIEDLITARVWLVALRHQCELLAQNGSAGKKVFSDIFSSFKAKDLDGVARFSAARGWELVEGWERVIEQRAANLLQKAEGGLPDGK